MCLAFELHPFTPFATYKTTRAHLFLTWAAEFQWQTWQKVLEIGFGWWFLNVKKIFDAMCTILAILETQSLAMWIRLYSLSLIIRVQKWFSHPVCLSYFPVQISKHSNIKTHLLEKQSDRILRVLKINKKKYQNNILVSLWIKFIFHIPLAIYIKKIVLGINSLFDTFFISENKAQ